MTKGAGAWTLQNRSLKTLTPGTSTCCRAAPWGPAHAVASWGWGVSGSWTELREVRTACLCRTAIKVRSWEHASKFVCLGKEGLPCRDSRSGRQETLLLR